MQLIVVGGGYVGLAAAAAFADRGLSVVILERDAARAATIAAGRAPFFEPQLDDLLDAGIAAGRLHVATDAAGALALLAQLPHGTALERIIALLAVGTPAADDGSTDEGQLLDAARELGAACAREGVGELTLVLKSTAPVGAASRVADAARRAAHDSAAALKVSSVVNPEFLRAGHAVHDFLHPDRVVVGGDDSAAVGAVAALYAGFVPAGKIMRMGEAAASLVKYASNAMLATRISFMNELAGLAAAVGADIDEVRRGVGADPRIGTDYLHPGMGYGGSCLPKDIASLEAVGRAHGVELGVIAAVAAANERQSHVVAAALARRLGALQGQRIAVWGLSFKGGSDDMRNSPGMILVRELLDAGASVAAFDPALHLSPAVQHSLFGATTPKGFTFAASAETALAGAAALAITADWPEFRSVDLERVASALASKIVVDGRNLLDPEAARRAGIRYLGIGRGESPFGT